ncbi:MAG TPA: serine/threonine-protein kinase, partial [Gemmatimonadales bacterium]|nr:serine/threonine-protein kinase [Gemmatimonadales bacterium]
RGGMGAVYLAERADGLYEQRVALKLLKRGMDTDAVLARFRAERQILASLDHPNIARLLDAGTTHDGLPFFAMEYVDGAPIDAWADARGASVEDRVRLVLQVCAAVSYAHQRLVVHRDIKPLNILVTAEGVPKLLDFGIAKVLQPGGEETSTVTGLRLLTPEYASPEQVEGRHATTASDVYSLGVVLYELLTGRSPYRVAHRTPVEVVTAMRTTDPERPSAAGPERHRRRLRGDLDTILLTALRKEPERRYPSVEQFADDLRRHLAGRPVRARPDTFGYRAGKFIRRNRGPVAAGVLAGLALTAGVVATAWQARLAREAQARAERRFADVRRLANALLFDYHDAIKDLRGATPVRERLVRDAIGWLDGLSNEARGDAGLQRELAAAYRRVGDLQGGGPPLGLGDEAGALASLGKALALLDALVSSGHDDPAVRLDLADVLHKMGELVWMRGDLPAGRAHARRADSLLAPLAVVPDDAALRVRRAETLGLLGRMAIDAGEIADAVTYHRAQLAMLEGLPPGERETPARRRSLSVAYGHLADAQVEAGDLEGALASHARSLAIREALADEFPDNVDYAALVHSARYYEGTVLQRLGRWADALERFRRLDREAPGSFASVRLGETLARLGRHGEAVPHLRAALRTHEAELRADTANLYRRLAVAEDRTRLCASLAALGDRGAPATCGAAASLMRGTPIEPTNAFPRAFFAGLWGDLGAAYETLPRDGRGAAAREAYVTSRDLWADLAARSLVSPADTARLAQAERAVARVTSAEP